MLPKTFPVTCHTNFVGPGSTFVAIAGKVENGITYIPQALHLGAQKIIVEKFSVTAELRQIIEQYGAQLVEVENARKALAIESARSVGCPAEKLIIYAVTGTKGKTTTAHLLWHILKTSGLRVGLLSSEGNIIHDTELPSPLTTPQPDYLHVFFQECIKKNITHVVMEVAAQAVSCHRIVGLRFDGLIFTNFSHEHGEFYNSLNAYFSAKSTLLDYLKPHAPVILNAEDELVSGLREKWSNSYLFGPNEAFCVHKNESSFDGLAANAELLGKLFKFTCASLLGDFNINNVIAAAGLAYKIGIDVAIISHAVLNFPGVPGRLNPKAAFQLPSGAVVFIDKAHNPSSFEAVLSTLQTFTNHLIVVFGAGGGRDHEKRPVMGMIAAKYAQEIIITTDNPRNEDPCSIVGDIIKGISPEYFSHAVRIEFDRMLAIKIACERARKGSIIALLGKGREQFQQINNDKIPFSEHQIVAKLCSNMPEIKREETDLIAKPLLMATKKRYFEK